MPKITSQTTKYDTRSVVTGKKVPIVERIWKLTHRASLMRPSRTQLTQAEAHDNAGRTYKRNPSGSFVCVETGEEFFVESVVKTGE